MSEPKIIKASGWENSIQADDFGFSINTGAELRGGMTSDFGSMFNGVELPKGASLEQRRVALYLAQEWMNFLEKIGWYEHTADWDQHAEIHLYDGRWTHNDGVFLKLDPPVHPNDYSREDGGPTHAVLEAVWATEEDYDEGTLSMLKEFGRNVRREDLSATTADNPLIGDLYIPIELIHRVNLGWCS